MSAGNPGITDILQQLRASFLSELPERLDKLEDLLIELEKSVGQETFNELYRGVHSLKGSGGTFGFHVVTSICHEFEDYLNQSFPHGGSAVTDNGLKFVDLLREVATEAAAGKDSFTAVEGKLAALHNGLFSRVFTGLVVANSKLIRQMSEQVLQSLSIRVVHESDSFAALHRALTQPFDLLIASSELPLLKGEALVAALRLSESHNRHVKAILISSNTALADHHHRATDADYVLLRDAKLLPNLESLVKTIRDELSGGASV